jgi:hypothetical protein
MAANQLNAMAESGLASQYVSAAVALMQCGGEKLMATKTVSSWRK